MELTLKNQKENKFLNRTEVTAEISYEKATPSNAEVKKACAEQLKVNESLIILNHVYPQFGVGKAEVLFKVYPDDKARDIVEVIKKKPKKKAEAGAAEPAKKKK